MNQPTVIKVYNEGIRGVELMDRLLESYHQGTTMKEIFLFVKILNVRFEAI